MQKNVEFSVEEIKRIDFSDYDEQEYSIARLGFISTRPNSHGIGIDEDCLRESAPSALGKWVVAKMFMGDATTHESDEHIVGLIPKDQEIEFIEDDDGYLRSYCDAIISKRYAKDFCEIFEKDNNRSVSIEARFEMLDDDNAKSFNICGITVLGKMVRPSCPESDITFVRFSESDAEEYYNRLHTDTLSNLKQFVETRKQSMAEKKTYKIDKSKEAMSDADWGDFDKSAMRDKIMEAKNRDTIVKAVYMDIRDGWQDAPSEGLKYPVMILEGDTFKYNRHALSAALSYAKQNGEQDVVDKVEKIYKKLDLDDNSEGKEEKMEEIKESVEMAEVEEPKQDEAEMAEPVAEEVVADPIEHEHDDDEDEPCDDDCEHKMSEDEMMAKIAQLEKDIEDRDHIIMERDTELADLRAYKAAILAKENVARVDGIMEEIKSYITDEQFASFREEGLACDESSIDAWSNKVKAVCFSEVKKNIKKDDSGVFSFAMPTTTKKVESNSIWDRLENK
uniref:Uncharacterized protein n=1 Tax=Siphoviridae sp. cteEQ43 TaxID=2827905 RepID=A0A8S5TCD2_9CAUD|nr:MAG TPA: hypothetical protein [Siphoviridae sp. cteEQ43]